MGFLPIENEERIDILNTCEEEGLVAAAIKLAEQYEKKSQLIPLEIAQVYLLANNSSKAMDWLERGYEGHDANTPYIGLNWFSNGPFKINDPGLIELLKRMNLPQPTD